MKQNVFKLLLMGFVIGLFSLNVSGVSVQNRQAFLNELHSTESFEIQAPDSFPSDCYASFWYYNMGTTAYFQNDSWSSTPITSCTWDFGDGTTSTDCNPEHIYASVGIYFVTLTISNGTCTSSTTLEVWLDNIVPQDCYADFWVYNLATTGFFNDMSWSIDTIDSWYWEFGDGSTSTLQNPQHQYATYGYYDVSLTITSDSCESTAMFGIWLDSTIAFECMAGFFYDYNPNNYNEIYFFDYSIAIDSITGWLWNFGDGNTSTLQNPVHEYLTNGMYAVTLTITTDSCENSYTDYVVIGNTPPGDCMADFSYWVSIGNYVEFFDYSWSMAPISSWMWDFGDGSTSTLSYPTHTYASAGVYLVSLTIQADSCSHTAYYPVYVDSLVLPDCAADFNWSQMGLEVSFYDYSMAIAPITSWLWNFGDGQTSTQQNPVHTYASAGFYEVMLTISTDSCSSSMAYYLFLDSVIIYDCEANFSHYASTSNPLQIDFWDNSWGIDPIVNWEWDFGDGSGSSIPLPTHIYTIPGDYLVTLSIKTAPMTFPGDTCYSMYEEWITVGDTGMCIANFSGQMNNNTATFTDLSTGSSDIVSWNWDFGDGTTSTVQHPVHEYAVEGTYTVFLTITSASGCSNSYSLEMEYIGIKELHDLQASRLFPNPAGQEIYLSTHLTNSKSIQISLMDFTSRLIMSKKVSLPQGNHTESLDIKELPKGAYFIRLDDGIHQEQIRFVK